MARTATTGGQTTQYPDGLEIKGPMKPGFKEILTPDALAFVAKLSRAFEDRRQERLAMRQEVQSAIDAGTMPDFLPETREIRESAWTVAPLPPDLLDRRVEITGPVERKMMINALNSGADGFMADFEDANAPTWHNMIEGQRNLLDAVERRITYEGSDGRHYELGATPATLLVRPPACPLPGRRPPPGAGPVRPDSSSWARAAGARSEPLRPMNERQWPVADRGVSLACANATRRANSSL